MNEFNMLETASYQGIKLYDARMSDWLKLNTIGIHLLNPTQAEIDDAISTAERDLFPAIVCYSLTDSQFEAVAPHYVNKV